MDPVTLIGIVAVAVMFLAGVTLVGMGLRRHPQRMPEGADAILAAVANGALAAPDRAVIDLTQRPAPAERSAATVTAKPLPEILAERAPTPEPADLVRPPATPPRAEASTPAVRLVPRPAATAVAERPAPAEVQAPTTPVVPRPTATSEILAAAAIDEPEPEAAPVAPADSTALFVADLNKALFDGTDEPETDAARSFLDAEPKLQRF